MWKKEGFLPQRHVWWEPSDKRRERKGERSQEGKKYKQKKHLKKTDGQIKGVIYKERKKVWRSKKKKEKGERSVEGVVWGSSQPC